MNRESLGICEIRKIDSQFYDQPGDLLLWWNLRIILLIALKKFISAATKQRGRKTMTSGMSTSRRPRPRMRKIRLMRMTEEEQGVEVIVACLLFPLLTRYADSNLTGKL